MQSKEFIDTLLFKLYEMFPGKWELIEDPELGKRKFYFNDKYTKFDITSQWIENIPVMPIDDVKFVQDTTFNAIVEKFVEDGI